MKPAPSAIRTTRKQRARLRFLALLGTVLGTSACGENVAPRAEAPDPPRQRAPESPPDQRSPASRDTVLKLAAPAPTAHEQAPASEAWVSQAPFPEPGGDLSLREAYAQTEEEMVSLSNLLGEKNREVVARYGRNDTPEALRILTPIRDRLQQARRHLDHLTCRDQPVRNAREELEQRRIPLDRFRVDRRWVDAYIQAKLVDGDISAAQAEDLRFVLSKSGHGVMNPSSLGAHTINQRIVQALICFGLSGPPRSKMSLPQEPLPPPKPSPSSRFRFFKTCGDAVCKSYRGPSPGVPRCRGEREGGACSQPGKMCDLANNCNMYLVCTDKDPATRCPR